MRPQRPKILIVDDEPNIRLVFRTSLDADGIDVVEAADGEEALARLHAEPFDLVLLDLRMPLVDGMEVLRRMRSEGIAAPVVLVTAHGSIPDAVRAMKLGAVDFLPKPIVPTALRGVVAEVLARHREMGPGGGRSGPLAPDVHRFGEALERAKYAMGRLRPDEAEAFLRRALEIDPRSAEVHTLLGVLFEARGEPDAARDEFRVALEADPDYAPATHNLRHLAARFGG